MPCALAAAMAALIERFGRVRVPANSSCPSGETKIAALSVPSIPSQSLSTNARSGRSGWPGAHGAGAGGTVEAASVVGAGWVVGVVAGARTVSTARAARQLLRSRDSFTRLRLSAQAISR